MDRDLPITYYDLFYGFNVFVSSDTMDVRLVRDESSKALCGSLKLSNPLGDGAVERNIVHVDTIQLLTDLSCIQTFLGEKLDDRSTLDIRCFLEMKTNRS